MNYYVIICVYCMKLEITKILNAENNLTALHEKVKIYLT